MRFFVGLGMSFTYKATSLPYFGRFFSIGINSVIFFLKESKNLLIYQSKIIFGAIGAKTKNCQNMKQLNTVLNSVTQYAMNGHTPLVLELCPYRQKSTFER